MDPSLLPFVAASLIDRAGVPTALVAGILTLETGSSDLWAFTLLCILASLLGDLACFWIGRHLVGRGDRTSGSFHGPSTLFGRISRATHFIDHHPRLWLFGSRLFPLVNQLIPMAAGFRRRPLIEAVWTNLAGAILWLGGWALATERFAYASNDWPVALRWGIAALGGLVLGLAIRRASREFAQPPDSTP